MFRLGVFVVFSCLVGGLLWAGDLSMELQSLNASYTDFQIKSLEKSHDEMSVWISPKDNQNNEIHKIQFALNAIESPTSPSVPEAFYVGRAKSYHWKGQGSLWNLPVLYHRKSLIKLIQLVDSHSRVSWINPLQNTKSEKTKEMSHKDSMDRASLAIPVQGFSGGIVDASSSNSEERSSTAYFSAEERERIKKLSQTAKWKTHIEEAGHQVVPLPGNEFELRLAGWEVEPTKALLETTQNASFGSDALASFETSPEDLNYFNKDFRDLYRTYSDKIRKKIKEKVEEEVKNLIEKTKNKSSRVEELLGMEHNLDEHFLGFERTKEGRVTLAIPAQGSWWIRLKVRAKVKYIGTKVFTVTVKDLKVSHFAQFQQQRTQVDLIGAEGAKVSGKVNIRLGNIFLNPLVELVEFLFDPLSKRLRESMYEEVVDSAKEDIAKWQKELKKPYGKDQEDFFYLNYPPVSNPSEVMQAVESKIFDLHIADENVALAYVENGLRTKWKDLAPYNREDFGKLQSYDHFTDSALFNGVLLASLAHKIDFLKREMLSQDYLKQVGQDLDRMEDLLIGLNRDVKVNGDGPMARAVFRKDRPENQVFINIITKGLRSSEYQYHEEVFSDEKGKHNYIVFHGENGVSRDQYVGAFYGLFTAYQKLDKISKVISQGTYSNRASEPVRLRMMKLRDKAKNIYLHALKYLMNQKWLVYANSSRNIKGLYDAKIPLYWAGSGFHKFVYFWSAMQMLQVGDEMYEDVMRSLEEEKRSLKTYWLANTFSVIEPHKEYYKYNLNHLLLLTLTQEKGIDALNYNDSYQVLRGVQIMLNSIGHHANAFFDLVQYRMLEEREGFEDRIDVLKERIPRDFNASLYKSHQWNMHTEEDYYDLTENYSLSSTEGKNGDILIADKMLPPVLRPPDINFQWQKSPYVPFDKPRAEWAKGGSELCGLGIYFTYWLGKNFGAL